MPRVSLLALAALLALASQASAAPPLPPARSVLQNIEAGWIAMTVTMTERQAPSTADKNNKRAWGNIEVEGPR